MNTIPEIRKHAKSYNERLFSGSGARHFFHNARFIWLKNVVADLNLDTSSVIEIGCFDGRSISFLPDNMQSYHGFDAGWEGGLDIGKDSFSRQQHLNFYKSEHPRDLDAISANGCVLGLAMETIEHIQPELVDAYLQQLSRIVDGSLIVTVPNEKGPLFLMKWLAKRIFFGGGETYTLAEVFWATLGKTDKIARFEHKGFNYTILIEQISRYFEVHRVESIPFGWLPNWMAFTIGIVASSRTNDQN